MKKALFLFTLGMSLCANAQLTVFENGQVRVGNNAATSTSFISTLDISDSDGPYSSSSHLPSGSITFGNGTNAMIKGGSGVGYLNLYAGANFEIGVGKNSKVLSLNYATDIVSSQY